MKRTPAQTLRREVVPSSDRADRDHHQGVGDEDESERRRRVIKDGAEPTQNAGRFAGVEYMVGMRAHGLSERLGASVIVSPGRELPETIGRSFLPYTLPLLG